MKKVILPYVLTLIVITVNAHEYSYDINKDGTISVTDVTFLVNNILGVPNGDEEDYTYDVNGDNVVNITDVTCLVNKILGVANPDDDLPSYLSCPDNNHPHLIDLGLPSGTKWACCNVGADNPIANGDYYAWSETEVKEEYNEDNYTNCNGDYPTPLIENDIAGTEYDVAHVKWGDTWTMPTSDQVEELIAHCTSEWTTLNEVSGRKFIGSNGSSIFLPAAGQYLPEGLFYDGKYGNYWSSTQRQGDHESAKTLYFYSKKCTSSADYFYIGQSIRPVSYVFPDLELSTITLTIGIGRQMKVDIISGSGSYTVMSSNELAATAEIVNSSVVVKALGKKDNRQAVITVTDEKSGQTATINVNVVVNLELSKNILCLAVGAQETVEITSGSGNYAVSSSDEAVATAVIDNNMVKVTCKGKGQAIITVTDTGTGLTENIQVFNPFALSATTISMPVDYEESVDISSGSGSFSVESNDEDVAKAVVRNNTVKVTAMTPGQATLTVRDLLSRHTSTLQVTVYDTFELATSTLRLGVGETKTVEATSGGGNYTIVSSDEATTTATIDKGKVKVTAWKEGTTTVTVTDVKSGQTATLQVVVEYFLSCPDNNHPHVIDLSMWTGAKWSCCNVGANNPWEYGDYYAWGETETKDVFTTDNYIYFENTADEPYQTIEDIAGTPYDVAHVKWGGSWTLPTKMDWEDASYCNSEPMTLKGVYGFRITGPNGKAIFIPAAGGYNRYNQHLGGGNAGYYWTSTLYNPNNRRTAYSYVLYDTSHHLEQYERENGFSVRPVTR